MFAGAIGLGGACPYNDRANYHKASFLWARRAIGNWELLEMLLRTIKNIYKMNMSNVNQEVTNTK